MMLGGNVFKLLHRQFHIDLNPIDVTKDYSLFDWKQSSCQSEKE